MRVLKERSYGNDVLWLQNALIQLKYDSIDATGYFDYMTYVVVEDFQRQHGLTVDGKVGNFTKTAIAEALGEVELVYPETDNFEYDMALLDSDVYAQANGIPLEFWGNLQKLYDALEAVQDKLGIELGWLCIYRSQKYEKDNRIKSTYRAHTQACAIDCFDKTGKYTTYQLAKAIYDDVELRRLFGGMGLGSKHILHLDVLKRNSRPDPTIWWYTYKSWKQWGR